MGGIYERMDDRLRSFIEQQHVVFVATSPSRTRGHVNVSPKGIGGTFAVLDDHTVGYLDITASGLDQLTVDRARARHGPPSAQARRHEARDR